MKSKLSVNIRKFQSRSEFVRTAPGRFFLRALLPESGRLYEAPPQVRPSSPEQVLVYPTDLLDRITTWQGILIDWKRKAAEIFGLRKSTYRARMEIEQDNRFTQILTYIVVSRHGSILSYRRGTYNRVDEFLKGAHCVGFGGHVTEADLNLFTSPDLGIMRSAARELSEELRLPPSDLDRLSVGEGLKLLGILNDDSSEVGRRHLAFVLQYEASEDSFWEKPARGEKAITQLRWISATDPSVVWLWNFEYWSQLCLREFAPKLVRAAPAYRILHGATLQPPNLLCVVGPLGSGKTLQRMC